MSFQYNVNQTLKKVNSCFYQLSYGKTGFVICVLPQFQEPIGDVK